VALLLRSVAGPTYPPIPGPGAYFLLPGVEMRKDAPVCAVDRESEAATLDALPAVLRSAPGMTDAQTEGHGQPAADIASSVFQLGGTKGTEEPATIR
jgi:hypothetical protein